MHHQYMEFSSILAYTTDSPEGSEDRCASILLESRDLRFVDRTLHDWLVG